MDLGRLKEKWNDSWGNPSLLEETLRQYYLFHHKSHTDSPHLFEIVPSSWDAGEWPSEPTGLLSVAAVQPTDGTHASGAIHTWRQRPLPFFLVTVSWLGKIFTYYFRYTDLNILTLWF
jgi:hypothetical protein